ncbi:MAG: N-acetyl-gamma-glutamyl-phosphate reductase [Acidobacteriota bacterium]
MMKSAVRVGIVGASGYSGGELVRWLHSHAEAEIVALCAGEQAGRAMSESFPGLRSHTTLELTKPDWTELAATCDVVFLALPHGVATEAVPQLLDGDTKVIDLGGDFRLASAQDYERWYGTEHRSAHLLEEAVYGLPELHREAIADSRLVANPGCYPTASLLALAPVAELARHTIVIDAKSGVSGAGRKGGPNTLYGEVNENLKPYGVGAHRHQPEIERQLGDAGAAQQVFFAPHLTPMTRGILSSCYVSVDDVEAAEIDERFHAAYDDEPFVRLLAEGDLPQTKATLASNHCDVAWRYDADRGQLAVYSAIDNLCKGAASQAVQNMNLLFGLPETTGLDRPPVFI